jgi:uncharacterized protein YdeI (YjbR/CyaY-like superfamily)
MPVSTSAVKVPADIKSAIAKSPVAAKWKSLAPSCKAEYLKWIEEAKKTETRANRIESMLRKLVAG